jgi:hypothetical protein
VFAEVQSGEQSIGEFFIVYNQVISELVQSSNFYRAAEIPGKFTNIEREAFAEENKSGIVDLNTSTPENSNFINKFMRYLHN